MKLLWPVASSYELDCIPEFELFNHHFHHTLQNPRNENTIVFYFYQFNCSQNFQTWVETNNLTKYLTSKLAKISNENFAKGKDKLNSDTP